MSRAIKFRAWGPNCKMMWDWDAVKRIANDLGWDNFDKGDRILMQFTGLTDANGVEIYEGDVVSIPGFGNGKVEITADYGVEYVNSEYRQPHVDGAAEGDFPTVIGNIYEHPHLLKSDN